jgi:hypothetical protein
VSTKKTKPKLGALLYAEPGVSRWPLAEMAERDPRGAAADALAAYLRAAVFCIPGKDPVRFRLNTVSTEWPEDFQELVYPAAGMTTPTIVEDPHSLTPTLLEESKDKHGRGTVLWKTAEQRIEFQVDFWVTNSPERAAIAAALPALFAPSEDRYGIMVQGPASYYDLPIRLTLSSHERQDTAESVERRDRPLRALIVADVDVVQLRRYVALDPRATLDGESLDG